MLRSTTSRFGKSAITNSINNSNQRATTSFVIRNTATYWHIQPYHLPRQPTTVFFSSSSSPISTDVSRHNRQNPTKNQTTQSVTTTTHKKPILSLTNYAKLAAYGYDDTPLKSKNNNNKKKDTTSNNNDKNNSNNLLSALLQEMNDTSTTSYRNADTTASKNSQNIKSLDQRANSKLLLLVEAKRKVEQTRLELIQQQQQSNDTDEDNSNKLLLLEQLKEDNQRLAMAYTQAIHYTARNKQSYAADKAYQLLEEWIDRTGAPTSKFILPSLSSGSSAQQNGSSSSSSTRKTKKKKATATTTTTTTLPLTQLLLPTTRGETPSKKYKPQKLPQLSTYITPPTQKSFHHVIQAYSIQNCKIPKKYIKMEQCLQRMAELALWYPTDFDAPNIDTILMGLKCLSNASFLNVPQMKKQSSSSSSSSANLILDRIQYLHSLLIEQLDDDEDDPIVPVTKIASLLYALKSKALQSALHRTAESKLCQIWLNDLYTTTLKHLEQQQQGRQELKVTINIDQVSSSSSASSTVSATTKTTTVEEIFDDDDDDPTINMESIINCLLSILKGYVRASRAPQQRNSDNLSCLEALSVLRKLQNLLELTTTTTSTTGSNNKNFLILEAYNLVLNSCQYCKQPKLALSIFQELLSSDDINTPNEKSFVYTIQSLASSSEEEFSSDLQQIILKTLTDKYNSGELAPATTEVFNALLELYCKWYDPRLTPTNNKHNLLDLVQRQLQTMEDMAFTKETLQGVQPDARSYTLLLKACSMASVTSKNLEDSTQHYQQKRKALQTAHETFEKMIDMERESPNILTDESFFYYMKCIMTLSQPSSTGDISNYTDDNTNGAKIGFESDKLLTRDMEIAVDDDVPSKIRLLFRQCCKKGLVSKNVLDILRKATTAEEYKKVVGEGRLPNHWFEHVTSTKTLYTNGKAAASTSLMAKKHINAVRQKANTREVKLENQNIGYDVTKKQNHAVKHRQSYGRVAKAHTAP